MLLCENQGNPSLCLLWGRQGGLSCFKFCQLQQVMSAWQDAQALALVLARAPALLSCLVGVVQGAVE